MPPDYSGQNLRGRSFRGQNLEGANFSYADIRSTDFSGTILVGANFSGVKAGLQTRWTIFLVLVSWMLMSLSGFLSAFTGVLVAELIFNPDKDHQILYQIPGWAVVVILIVFFFVSIREGIQAGLGAVAGAFAVAGAVAFAVAVAVAGAGAGAGTVAVAVAGAVAIAVAAAFAVAAALAVDGAFAATAALAAAFAVAAALTGAADTALAGATAGAVVGFSTHISWYALKGDPKQALIRNIAVAFAAFRGTSFRSANLTDANFTVATLKNTDFRKANLTRTSFHKSKKLDRVRPGSSYLQISEVRDCLVAGRGSDKNFDRLDLRGINFKGAILIDASFQGADLSDANLQDADLSRAKLVQAQLDGTDFTGATLTGAYIKDWNITSDTKFDGVRCEYVYMRLPTKENPEPLRKPDNNKEVFADGEFGDFIQPIFDTLDLYHNQGVDPRAIAISFKQLAENHPEAELRIVGMEVKGEDKFLLRARTATTAEKSELSAEYFDTYNQIKGLPEREIRLLLLEKDSRIRSLETMVTTALERPNFYSNTQVDTVSTMTSNPGGFSVGGSVGGNVNNVQGDGNRTIQGNNNQGVLGDNNQVTQQNQVGVDTGASLTKEDVIKLFAELEALVKTAQLPAEAKEEVIEDLSSAKNATDKEEPNKNRALERLGSVAETLEKTSKTVESGQKIWTTAKPIIVKIATWLGAAAGSQLLGL